MLCVCKGEGSVFHVQKGNVNGTYKKKAACLEVPPETEF